jgi:CRISPR-associated protein Cas1
VFDDLILQQKEDFYFDDRNRRPPVDNVNAMLSFLYAIFGNDVAAALETVGLDPYVGFLHRDRPGRAFLALDLMEEFRSVYADRFVLSLINKRAVNKNGFVRKENGAIFLEDSTRKTILTAWRKRKQEEIIHPFLEEKIEWGACSLHTGNAASKIYSRRFGCVSAFFVEIKTDTYFNLTPQKLFIEYCFYVLILLN